MRALQCELLWIVLLPRVYVASPYPLSGCAPADQDEPVTVDQVNACMRFASAEDLFAARRGIGGSLLDWSDCARHPACRVCV